MAITEFAKQYHEKMFPGYVSKFLETDPEFIERFDSFAFDEVINQPGQEVDDKTRFMAILATLLGCQGIDEFRAMLPAALNFGVTPVEVKELTYQAVAYLGIGRVFPFLNTDFPDDIDAVSSATLSRSNGELKGNAQLMAEWMADEAGAELFAIQTENTYPIDYHETTDVAKQEQNANARPTLKTRIDGFDGYSTVYLVFPNWWADLPMALYSFFDEYDFSDKTLYVSITHEGSGFSRTVGTIQDLEPNATVIEGISIRGSSVPDSQDTVRQFVRGNQ